MSRVTINSMAPATVVELDVDDAGGVAPEISDTEEMAVRAGIDPIPTT